MPLAKEVAKTKGSILLAKDSHSEFSTKETLIEFLDDMKTYAIKEIEKIQRQLKKGEKHE